MRELIEYLVARKGAEGAVARVAAGTHQQFLCLTGSPITIVYSGEKFAGGAAAEIRLDRGSQMCRVTGTGAGRA
jgi:hypothetical protein